MEMQQQLATDVARLMDHLQKSGLRSIQQVKDFLYFAAHEGKSLSEITGKAGTPEYTKMLLRFQDIAQGRAAKGSGPDLLKTVNRRGHRLIREVRLTPKGRRLLKRLGG